MPAFYICRQRPADHKSLHGLPQNPERFAGLEEKLAQLTGVANVLCCITFTDVLFLDWPLRSELI